MVSVSEGPFRLFRREGATTSGAQQLVRPDDRPRARPAEASPLLQARAWIVERLERLPSSRILLWLVVALIVAAIVLLAFTLASSQAHQVGSGGL